MLTTRMLRTVCVLAILTCGILAASGCDDDAIIPLPSTSYLCEVTDCQ
ncbi:MAG: hypothetical protein O7B26_10840 [Planctomycetota bacterium]|nr:hypothetical protein [Planctomycetota bacterium]